jgi:hypothetical protein
LRLGRGRRGPSDAAPSVRSRLSECHVSLCQDVSVL